jgi:CubicO group peptidase (beta-lactamase class C family)
MRSSLAFVLALFGACTTAAPRRPATTATLSGAADIDSIFAEFDRPGSPGCAVGVYRAGELRFAKGYGMASIEHAVPITARTPFVVGSVAKHFTGFAVHLLARRGKLSLDDAIRRHLPEVPDLGDTVTVRHLLHHTSGFRSYEDLLSLVGWNRDHPLSREQALATVAAHRTLGFPPGERYQYGNTNYILLAEIVERTSGLPFAEFMKHEVFGPLGMTSSHVRTDPLAVVPGRAEHYWPGRGGGFRRNYIWAFPHATGASNVVTTLEDLARWDANFFDERVGGPGISATMYEAGVLRSGDRIGGLGSYRGLLMYAQGGGGGGDYSVVRFPQQRLSVAVLCNLGLGAGAHDRALRVADSYLRDATASAAVRDTPNAVALTEETLRGFVGEYRNPQNRDQRVRIDVRDGTLGYTQPGGGFQPAVPVGPRTFRSGPLTFEFSVPVPGAPDRITYEVGGQRGTLVRWEAPPPLRAAELAVYLGAYRSEELDARWTVALHGDTLVLRRPRLADRALAPVGPDSFRWEEPFEDEGLEVELTFVRSPEGRVNGVRVETDRVSNLQFTRVEDRR